jgi:coproporphyrinogen III oxidase-like Fe-S oxidoreductase
MTKPAKVDAARWLERFGKLYAKHDRSIYGWRVVPHTSGIMLEIDVERGTIPVLVQPHGRGSSYAKTASLALSIHTADGQHLPGNAETVLQGMINVLRRADKGNLHVAGGGQGPGSAFVQPTRDLAQIAEAHAAHAEALHWAQYLALQALVTEDLYPHVGPLGELVDQAEIEAGWAATAERIKDGTAPSQLGLYVHIPFCTVACTFCFCGKTDDFDRQGMSTYQDQLAVEAEGHAERMAGIPFTSVYFGGGTPSLLTPPAMRRMFEVLYGTFTVPEGTQIIFEGNPDSLSEGKIAVLAEQGRVSRLTIGVQTLDDAVQAKVKRFNKPEHVASAVAAARKHGITHVNCDLMAGLPEQTLASFQKDLRFLLSLEPDSLHLNGFRPLPRTRLGPDAMTPERVGLRDEMLAWGIAALADAGHGSDLGQGPRRTRNAANLQEYDLRRQNSSLLGLGFPARSHSFGSHYYAPELSAGFDPSLRRELGGDRQWRAIRADGPEEQHKYLVSNFRTGFTRTDFQQIFDMDPVQVAPEGFAVLEQLGVVHVGEEEISCNVQTAVEDLVYRTFLYSPEQMERAHVVWGPDYDRSADYAAQLEKLVESCG